jgi:molybdenum cofactor cytidylyltransferase
MTIVALLLAAGASSRFGGPNKLLLPFGDGEVVIQRVARTIHAAGVEHIVVVTGHQQHDVMSALKSMQCEFVHNPRYAEGEMISSIRVGLAYLTDTATQAALIVLGDQPLIPVWVIRQLSDAFGRGCGDILAPKFRAQRGHPVLIARRFWPEAMQLPDGAAMRTLLQRHPNDVAHLLVNSDVVLRDVDTPALYAEAVKTVMSHEP